MTLCELCGAEIKDEDEVCPRCGYEFPKSVHSDSRDQKILAGKEGVNVEDLKRNMRDKLTYLTSYFENLEVRELVYKEFPSFLEEALGLLHVPMTIGMGDELKFNEKEQNLIKVIVAKLDQSDNQVGDPVASTRSYIRLANALHCLGEADSAMRMIDKALLKEPANLDALFGKAKLLFYQKRYGEAKRYLNKLMAKDDKYPRSVYLAEMIEQLSARE